MSRVVDLRSIAVDGGIVGGPFGSSLGGKDYVSYGVPVIRGTNLGAGKYIGGDYVYVTEEKVESDLRRNTAMQGDVVFTQRGTLGQVALVPTSTFEKYVISQSQMRLRVEPAIASAEYVYYACSDSKFTQQVRDNAISTGVPHINLGILSRLQIPFPDVSEQQAIAEVLGALDDKIAANAAATATAWQLARAEFVQVSRSATASQHLSDLLRLEYGKSLPATAREQGEVSVVGSGGIVGNHSEAIVKQSGVVVGRKGSAGSVHWVDGPHWPIDTTFYAVPTSPDVSQPYAYFLLESLKLDQMNSDSAVPGLNRKEAEAIKLRVPTGGERSRFTERVTTLLGVATQMTRESRALAELRDSLLPELMSGRLRVKDAEAGSAAAGL